MSKVAWAATALVAAIGIAAGPTTARAAQAPVTNADAQRWAATWNSHNIGTVLAILAKDVQIDQPENPKPLDYQGARGFFTMIFRAYPDFHVTVRQWIAQGNAAVSVEQVTGTWSGPFIDPASGKSTPGNGRRFDHPGAMVIAYDAEHKINHISIYWDQLTVDHQLGITPK
ncbi:MAG TPA: ester cyclase [Candidatus Lustribacter sp.]|nr:ester cyclase [Candidatus Lustribacter sp.]